MAESCRFSGTISRGLLEWGIQGAAEVGRPELGLAFALEENDVFSYTSEIRWVLTY